MQQDLEGGETRARPPRASESITQLCSDPRKTRDRAELGEPTPCHRCLAYEPDTMAGCLFLERHPMKLAEPDPEPAEQQTLFTEDTSG